MAQHAIEDLVNSCRWVQTNEQRMSVRFTDLQGACDELLDFTFHSENGRLQVIEKLTKLNGNFVVKIIRKGLLSLSKVYTDAKTFEDEAIKLVELCCSQSESMQNGSENGQQIASPAIIIDWTVELCDELMKTKENFSPQSIVLLSNCLSKIKDLYETIIRSRLHLINESDNSFISIKCFKNLFEIVKPRIQFEAFEELIEQTAVVVKTEEKLDFMKLSQIISFKQAVLLSEWLNLLKVSSVTNWFAVKTATHDFLVQDEIYAQSLPFSNNMTYNESLICKVADTISSLMTSVDQYEFPCDKERLKIFFDHSEVFLRHTLPCFHLIQSKDISTNLIEDLFFTLGIKLNRALLPVITDSDLKNCEIVLSPDVKAMITQALHISEKNAFDSLQQLMFSRLHQTSSFNAMTQVLVSLPDKQQVLKVLRLWKQHFPNDSSYHMLSEIFVLVNAVIQMKRESISNDMEQFITFLSQLSSEFLHTLPIWRPLMEQLIPSLPHSWDSPEILHLIRIFVDKPSHSQSKNALGDASPTQKLHEIQGFVQSLKNVSKSEEVKIQALKLGLDLFEDVPQSNEYAFVLNVILSIASDMATERIRQYTLNLLQTVRVHSSRIQYPNIWEVIKSIDNSCCIERKSEVFECYLEFLQGFSGNNILFIINACCDFLQFYVNTDSTKRFFAHTATGRLDTCQFILKCLNFNKGIITEDRMNEHINFLFKIVDETLSLSTDKCELFFTTVQNCLQLQILSFSSIDVFEVILASIAGSIAVGTFDSNLNEAILKVLHAAVHTHQLDQPMAVLSFLIDVTQTIHLAQCFEKPMGYVKVFAAGLCLIARLPLTLQQINRLMHTVTTILDQENITNEQEVGNIMFHLFQMPSNESTSSVDSNDLDLHFEKLLKPSIIRNVAKIPLMRKEVVESTCTVSLFSLLELLVERMPKTFGKGTSADLFQFIVQRAERNCPLSFSIFPVVEAITKKNVSEAELKTEVEEIEKILLRVSPAFIPFIGECIKECHIIGLSEEQSIKTLILQILESLGQWNLNVDDTYRMIGSILSIPKQLVLTFKQAANAGEAKEGMARIFDVVEKLDPSIVTGNFLLQFTQELQVQLRELIEHDFCMLLKHTSLRVADVCSAMVLYPSLEPRDLLVNVVLDLSRNENLKSLYADNNWSNTQNQFPFPTPGNLAYLVIHELRRLEIPDTDVRDTTIKICCKVLRKCCLGHFRRMPWEYLPPTPKEYLELSVSIIKKSSYLAEIEHWLNMDDCYFAVQCKNVIMAACSWKAGNKSCEEALRMNNKVSATFSNLITKKAAPYALVSNGVDLVKELEVMALVIKTYEDEDVAYKLFELLCTSRPSTEVCLDIMSSWSKNESLLLVDKINNWYRERNTEINPEQSNNEMEIPLKILPFAAKAFPNSAVKLFDFLTTIAEKNGGPDDHLSLGRLPVWYKQMTDAGYDSQAIQSWCTSLVISQNLCSSDVDAITNLTPEIIKLLTKETDEIGRCLFSLDASESLNTDQESFKRSLLLARLLNEFASIAGQLKEDLKVVQRIREGALALCSSFLDTSPMGNLYKIRYNILKELFVLLFGGENGEHTESLKQLTTQGPLSKSLVILFRRLARSVVSRPITFGHVKSIVHKMVNHNVENSSWQYQEIQSAIHEKVLNFESNQDAIHTLQASGYNQSTATKDDLWYSSSIEMPAHVTTIKSFESSRTESLLRQLWREWRTILTVHDISEVEVNGEMLRIAELFKMSDSLEIMESQLQSVQKAIRLQSLQQNDWSNHRRRQLLRNERRLRDRIKEQATQVKEMTGTKLTKMVVVWENQLLESVKTCSEKIPDCYAPNGFHSEKPVICGITVDNRILTLYKEEEGGSRTEVENVEVKLFPAGMVVFGLYRCSHPYDTDQLWAAFFKMLLDKRLVPKIFLSNISPAFDWIKQFITPETSPPRSTNFLSCCDLIPSSEDSFDYDPDTEILGLHTVLAGSHMKELIILTPDKAKQIQIRNIKAPIVNRKQLIKEQREKVLLHLKKESQLQKLRPQSHDKILKRLMTSIRKAVEISVDGNEPTEESISSSIDMKKLLCGCQDAQQYSKDTYSVIILDALKTVTGELTKQPETLGWLRTCCVL